MPASATVGNRKMDPRVPARIPRRGGTCVSASAFSLRRHASRYPRSADPIGTDGARGQSDPLC